MAAQASSNDRASSTPTALSVVQLLTAPSARVLTTNATATRSRRELVMKCSCRPGHRGPQQLARRRVARRDRAKHGEIFLVKYGAGFVRRSALARDGPKR